MIPITAPLGLLFIIVNTGETTPALPDFILKILFLKIIRHILFIDKSVKTHSYFKFLTINIILTAWWKAETTHLTSDYLRLLVQLSVITLRLKSITNFSALRDVKKPGASFYLQFSHEPRPS